MKASDYEAVVQNHPELKVVGIKVYHDVSELASDFQGHQNAWPFRDMPLAIRALLTDFKLSDSTIATLKDFGHTDQEIEAYEKTKNAERLKVRSESQFLKHYIKVARGIWTDTQRQPLHLEELREYLDNCGIDYTWDPD
jgi:hypothetical protein